MYSSIYICICSHRYSGLCLTSTPNLTLLELLCKRAFPVSRTHAIIIMLMLMRTGRVRGLRGSGNAGEGIDNDASFDVPCCEWCGCGGGTRECDMMQRRIACIYIIVYSLYAWTDTNSPVISIDPRPLHSYLEGVAEQSEIDKSHTASCH